MRRVSFALLALAACLPLTACGAKKSQSPIAAQPTVSLWVSSTAKDYRQVAAGAKLALSESGGHAGAFRVNYAGRQVSDDPANATKDALANARTSLQDTQVSAVVTSLADAQARPAITLLNSAGISTVALGDAALKTEACSDASDIYPSGHPTAIVIPPDATIPPAFRTTFTSTLNFAPTPDAYRAYLAVHAILTSLGSSGIATTDHPPRLDRDALAAQLVRAHGDCA